MTGTYQPRERVTIHWPGGPHDFVIEFGSVEPAEKDGWLYVQGLVVSPDAPEYRHWRRFWVQPVEDGYALLPKIGPPVSNPVGAPRPGSPG